MAPFKALYGKCCRSPICWGEVGEQRMLGPELVQTTNAAIQKIRARMLTAQSRQKSYADVRRKNLEFEVRDMVFLKVAPMKGVLRFVKKGKLSPRFVGPFEIQERIGPVAYRLALPPSFSAVHDVFHVSMLRSLSRSWQGKSRSFVVEKFHWSKSFGRTMEWKRPVGERRGHECSVPRAPSLHANRVVPPALQAEPHRLSVASRAARARSLRQAQLSRDVLDQVTAAAWDFFSRGSSMQPLSRLGPRCLESTLVSRLGLAKVVPAWVSFEITTYLGLCGPTGHQSSMDIDMTRVTRRGPRIPIVLGVPRDIEDQSYVPTGAHVARVRERARDWVEDEVRAKAS
ncbi:pol protein [Cucumis melo var. makuwa]|uniref:Pol protein n=1 Tax=Cucumis melo var. makuwa TaxID=1194695 RepID=A0A5A7VDN2_CUCMM|nr:pol protein [Cucumis melo var. makuwa]